MIFKFVIYYFWRFSIYPFTSAMLGPCILYQLDQALAKHFIWSLTFQTLPHIPSFTKQRRPILFYFLDAVTCVDEMVNPLAPNDIYISRTAQLTSRRCILNIYSTNILTDYFKHAAHSPFFFSLQDAVYFIMLSFLVPVIFTF